MPNCIMTICDSIKFRLYDRYKISLKNVDSGHMCRLTTQCVIIIYVRLYVGFVKCNSGLMR